MKTYFITENYLKKYTGYNNNIDMSKVEYLIETTYDIVIVDLLGTYYSNYLLERHQEVINNLYTYTIREQKIVDLIQRTMAWRVNEDSVIELSTQLQNKGTLKQSGDYQSPADFMAVNDKKRLYKQNFEDYKRRLNLYICRFHEDLVEFMDIRNDDSLIKNNCSGCNKGRGNDLDDYGIMFI